MIQRHFTALKGLAIVLVVLNHAITLGIVALERYGYAPPAGFERYLLAALEELGLIAVPTFLFLSGCYAVYAVQDKGLVPAYRIIWGSLKHVIWPYLIWSTLYYVSIYVRLHHEFTLPEYSKDLLYGFPFDYVPLLVFFYVASPFLVLSGRRHPWLLLAAMAAYQLFLINVNTPGALGITFPSWARYLSPPILRSTLSVWGIQFPLGVVYGLHAKALLSTMKRFWPVFVAAAAVGYAWQLVAHIQGQDAPLAVFFCPIPVMLLFPLLKRESIPLVKILEQFGKKAYGLYLTNLIVVSIELAGFNVIAPWVFRAPILLASVLTVVTLAIPTWLMAALERWPMRRVQRYVFG